MNKFLLIIFNIAFSISLIFLTNFIFMSSFTKESIITNANFSNIVHNHQKQKINNNLLYMKNRSNKNNFQKNNNSKLNQFYAPIKISVSHYIPNLINIQPTNLTQPTKWEWPIKGDIKILKEFNHQNIDYYSGHRGIDIFATINTKVYAPFSGIITLNRKVFSRNVLLIDHNNGYRSTLESIDSKLKVGEFINKGQYLGNVNNLQIHSNNSLYWGVLRNNEKYINPIILINNTFAKLIM